MKYTLFSLIFGLLATFTASAQTAEVDNTPYKIVMQLTSGDTAVHRGLIKQINNVLNAAPKSRIEVVCHNNGLSFLISAKTFQAEAIKKLNVKGVTFVACENTMHSQKVKREELVPEAGTVPAGVIEIVKKQGKKWAYLKAG